MSAKAWDLDSLRKFTRALSIELKQAGLDHRRQCAITVRYLDYVVGEYVADLLVEGSVIIELKATRDIERIHQAQLLNYLRATGIRKGLILNFDNTRLGIKRMVLTRNRPEGAESRRVSEPLA